MSKIEIENLVFEGGGVRGIAFAGAVKYLEEINILKDIKRFAGSSAGAWAATMLAIGYNSYELNEILSKTDIGKLKDNSKGCQPFSFFKNMIRLCWYYSWYKGDLLEKLLGDLLEQKTGNRDITFKQIYEKYGIELVITATNVDQARTIYFHRHSYPDFLVRIAVRASMALPLYYKPIKVNGEYLIDGGFLNNYPIGIFDDCENVPATSAECANCVHKPNVKTLGLKLVGPDEKIDEFIFHGKLDTHLLRYYILALIDCMGWQIERSSIKPGYWERTIIIPTHGVKTTDFDLHDVDKTMLFNSGFESTMNFFQKAITNTDNVDRCMEETKSSEMKRGEMKKSGNNRRYRRKKIQQIKDKESNK